MSDYVKPSLFAKDHWSTLAYMETIMVDYAGFEVGFDERMRQNRRHWLAFKEQLPKPRGRAKPSSVVGCMWEDKYSTVLADDSVVSGHDDWCCVQDMAEAGFFTVDDEIISGSGVDVGVNLKLSDLGLSVVSALRRFKMDGGSFSRFRWDSLEWKEKTCAKML